jgi:hypothetical protein
MDDETEKAPATEQKSRAAQTPVPSTEAMAAWKDKEVS